MFCLCVCLYTTFLFGACEGQKRASSPLGEDGWIIVTDSCESPCWFWVSNLGPLQEQRVLSTTGPSLQPRFFSCSHDRTPDKSISGKAAFFFGSQFEGAVHKGRAGKPWQQVVTSHANLQLESRGGWTQLLTSLFSLHSAQNRSPWNSAPHSSGGSSLETPWETHPELFP